LFPLIEAAIPRIYRIVRYNGMGTFLEPGSDQLTENYMGRQCVNMFLHTQLTGAFSTLAKNLLAEREEREIEDGPKPERAGSRTSALFSQQK